MGHLTVLVLGSFQVLRDNHPVTDFATDKTRALLAYLAVEARHPHYRTSLASLFWPDLPEPQARQNLRRTLHRLRLAIADPTADPPLLLSDQQTVQFNRHSNVRLDLAEFQAALRQVGIDTAPHLPDPAATLLDPARVALLQQCIGLYRGDFLADSWRINNPDFEAWIQTTRESLRTPARAAMAQLALHLLQAGAAGQAIARARQAVAFDPLHEASQRLLMLILARTGERSAAIAQYDLFRRTLQSELAIEPDAATRSLYEQICAGNLLVHLPTIAIAPETLASGSADLPQRPAIAPARPVWNVPVPLTPFFGREAELSLISSRLQQPTYRLITILGPGGTGKTRLALQVATANRPAFRHGVCFVSLIDIASAPELTGAIVDALGLPRLGNTPLVQQLQSYLHERELLLVLDNLEQVPDAAELLADLLRQAPGLLILATSRRRLGMQAEDVVLIHGLAMPDGADLARCGASPAVQLFVDRARRVDKHFALDAQTAAPILHICRLVDGLPLAIELAAARVRLRPCAEIAHELADGLASLAADWPDVPVRHRSISAMFDQARQLLRPPEQLALRGLAIFHAGCTFAAARSILGVTPALLAGLVDQSLLWLTTTGRYVQHNLLWQYAREKLRAETTEFSHLQAVHAAFYAEFLQAQAALLRGPQELQAMVAIHADIENIRAAWFWAIEHAQLTVLDRATRSLFHYYDMHGDYAGGEQLFAAAQNMIERFAPPSHELPGRLLACRGLFAIHQGDYSRAETLLQQSMALLATAHNAHERFYPLQYLAALDCLLGRFAAALPRLEASLELAENGGDLWECAYGLMTLGLWHALVGEHQRARECYEESLQKFNLIAEQRHAGRTMGLLGATLYVLGQIDQARHYLQAGLRRLRELGDPPRFSSIQVQIMLAGAPAHGNYADLEAYVYEVMASASACGDERISTRTLIILADLARLQGRPEAEWAHLQTALHRAHRSRIQANVLLALMRCARLLSRAAPPDRLRAIEILCYALEQPLTFHGDRQIAETLQAELVAGLPPDQAAIACQRGRTSSLDQIVASLGSMNYPSRG
jgi:predicted ATPase/DNA-binding SARP family transcriptional activator